MFSIVRVARLVALKIASPMPATLQICRHANRVWMGSAPGRSVSDNRKKEQEDILLEDLDMDAVEAKLESLLKEEKKIWKTIKFHKIRRQLSSHGAPERRLTWDAIEQIRYLKQEFPQEWTVQRLADSYSVTPDVISRILRSKFMPTVERKVKQDSKVLATARQLSLGHGKTDTLDKGRSRLPVPVSTTPARLSLSNTGTIACQSRGALAKMEFETALAPAADNVTLLLKGTSQISAGLPMAQSTSQERPREEWEEEEEENWDGVVFTEEELEDLICTLHEKPNAVEQKGNEFFDSEGNFLYRI